MIYFKRPMLAAPLLPPDLEHTDDNILAALQRLRYPVLASLKLDGIRALRLNGSLLSRTLKPIPNKSIRERSLVMPGGFDMELWSPSLQYHEIESIVMSREHPDSDKIQFHVLDWFGIANDYRSRHWRVATWVDENKFAFHSNLHCCLNADDLFNNFLQTEAYDGEGICFRTPDSLYKQGRSTLKEQYLVKLCRYVTEEAIIVGFVEQQANCNPEKRNKLGLMNRSSDIAGQVGKNTLGAFVVQNESGTFTIGTGVGLTNNLRQTIWDNQSKYLGRIITYKCKSHGKKLKPRSPIMKGFRDNE